MSVVESAIQASADNLRTDLATLGRQYKETCRPIASLTFPPLLFSTMAYPSNDTMDRSFIDADVEDVLAQMTVAEKISLLAGRDWWK